MATPPYLSLISSAKDFNNPNSLGAYQRNLRARDGNDAWIVMLDGGFDIDRYPHELSSKDTSRTIQTHVVPAEIRHPPLRGPKPESDPDTRLDLEGAQDFGKPDEDTKIPRGHGTPMAIIAGGAESGVAPKSNLYLMKQTMTKWDTKTGKITFSATHPMAVVHSLHHVLDRIDKGKLPAGKTVLVIPYIYPIRLLEQYLPNHATLLRQQFLEALDALSKRGVVVVVPALMRFFTGIFGSGDEENDMEKMVPHCHLTPDTDTIVVGATDQEGRLWWNSTSGSPNCPVSVYAQGCDTQAWVLSENTVGKRVGTCFAAAQVAGLAAYFLSHPDYKDHLKYSESDKTTGNTVGKRMKELIMKLAYQRVPDDRKLDPEHLDKYDHTSISKSVDVIYNGIHGAQK